MNRSPWIRGLIASILLSLPVYAQSEPGPARLLADLHPGSVLSFDFPQHLSGFTRAGNRSVFLRNENEVHLALWATDGTAEGTRSLGIIGLYFDIGSVVPFGSTAGLAFYGVGFEELVIWRTDGTPAGTFPVTRGLKRPPGGPEALGSVSGGRLFFNACSAPSGCELWSSDGSVAGTKPAGEIVPGPESGGIREIESVDGRAFVIADAPGGATALWLADAGGLKRLRETPGAAGLSVQLAQGQGRVFFFARDASGFEVWTSNGTAAGTRPVTSFAPAEPFPEKRFLNLFSGRAWFVADNGTHGRELWSVGGQPGSVRRVSNFPDPAMSFTDVGKSGARIVFVAARPGGERKIWTSRGDFRSTAPLSGCQGGCPSLLSPLAPLTPNRFVLYGASQRGTGFWVTDGTRAGTRFLRRSPPHDSALAAVPTGGGEGGRVLFQLVDESLLGEIWITNGTTKGTFHVTEGDRFIFDAGTADGATVFAGAGETLEDWPFSEVLWRSDGTPAGSRPLTEAAIPRSSAPALLTPFRDGVFVQTCPHVADWEQELWFVDASNVPSTEITRLFRDPADACRFVVPVVLDKAIVFVYNRFHQDLWRSDGTQSGTSILVPEASGPSDPFPLGDEAGFYLQSELWVTDGTLAGTRKYVGPPPPEGIFLAGRYWFFRDSRPWVSDGTPAGTYPVTEADGQPGHPSFFVEAGGLVYFPFAEVVGGEAGPMEIWSSDETVAGTGPAITADSGALLSALAEPPLVAGDRLYFAAPRVGDPQGTLLPWSSDGTDAGTVLLANVDLRGDDLAPVRSIFTEFDGRVYFAASDPRQGNELWSTDGTRQGTSRLLAIAPRLLSAYPRELTVWNGRLYFRARDGVHGMELWSSDGTAAGTRLVHDIAPGASWSTPRNLTPTEERLFFSADDGVHGEEVWVLERDDV